MYINILDRMKSLEQYFSSKNDSPYHAFHVKEYMRYTNAAMDEVSWQVNSELKNIYDALSALEARVERLEATNAAAPPSNGSSKKGKPVPVEAEVYITQESIQKLRNAIANIFK